MRVPIWVEIEPELLRAIQRAALERKTTAEAIAVEVLEEWRREGTARERRSANSARTAAKLGQQYRNRSRVAPFGWRLIGGAKPAEAHQAERTEATDAREPTPEEAQRREFEGARDRAKIMDAFEKVASREARQRLEPDVNEARILRRMVRLRSKGLGPMRIANRLNERKRDHNPRTGEPWKFGNVQTILRTYDRRKALGVHEPPDEDGSS